MLFRSRHARALRGIDVGKPVIPWLRERGDTDAIRPARVIIGGSSGKRIINRRMLLSAPDQQQQAAAVMPTAFTKARREASCASARSTTSEVRNPRSSAKAAMRSERAKSRNARDRAIGGLGVHLVRQMMDTVSYTHEAGHNRLQMTKQIHQS